jgi:hypothetical protein
MEADTGTSHLASKGPLKGHEPLVSSTDAAAGIIAIIIPAS